MCGSICRSWEPRGAESGRYSLWTQGWQPPHLHFEPARSIGPGRILLGLCAATLPVLLAPIWTMILVIVWNMDLAYLAFAPLVIVANVIAMPLLAPYALVVLLALAAFTGLLGGLGWRMFWWQPLVIGPAALWPLKVMKSGGSNWAGPVTDSHIFGLSAGILFWLVAAGFVLSAKPPQPRRRQK